MARAYKKGQIQRQPEGRLRPSQAVTTFGPGAMMDLVDQAVLIGGLDFWTYDKSRDIPKITEPRLRDALAEQLKGVGVELSEEQAFLEPPAGDDSAPSKYAGIQVLEFPQWFVCQNPACRSLTRRDGLDLKSGKYLHNCSSTKKGSETVPVRFVGACKKGHVEDFPWIAFAHLNREGTCAAPSLSLEEGASGDFSEIEVRCACGARNQLSRAMANLTISCAGQRPWLGPEGRQECSEELRLLVRTASNSYFSQVVSALSVPEPGRELDEAVQRVWGTIRDAEDASEVAFFRKKVESVRIALEGFDSEDVMAAIRARIKGTSLARLPLRTAEYLQLVASKPEAPGELAPLDTTFFARTCKPKGGLCDGVAKIVLASKLREVRAQIGFTRLEAITPDLQGEFDLGVQSARLGLTSTWLPASEVRGEGVFLALDERAVQAWEARVPVVERGKELLAGYDDWKKSASDPPPFPGTRFYMLHSLAHLLISAISLECGYSASAIRERIYCGPSARDPKTPMAAILLSTGSSGTEGTLGGLVEEGRKLRTHLGRAYDLGRLCSNDPVCAAHTPNRDRAERYLEGAACHGCLFIAECSCERFNRYLDRALVIPTVGHPRELAFFTKRP